MSLHRHRGVGMMVDSQLLSGSGDPCKVCLVVGHRRVSLALNLCPYLVITGGTTPCLRFFSHFWSVRSPHRCYHWLGMWVWAFSSFLSFCRRMRHQRNIRGDSCQASEIICRGVLPLGNSGAGAVPPKWFTQQYSKEKKCGSLAVDPTISYLSKTLCIRSWSLKKPQIRGTDPL